MFEKIKKWIINSKYRFHKKKKILDINQIKKVKPQDIDSYINRLLHNDVSLEEFWFAYDILKDNNNLVHINSDNLEILLSKYSEDTPIEYYLMIADALKAMPIPLQDSFLTKAQANDYLNLFSIKDMKSPHSFDRIAKKIFVLEYPQLYPDNMDKIQLSALKLKEQDLQKIAHGIINLSAETIYDIYKKSGVDFGRKMDSLFLDNVAKRAQEPQIIVDMYDSLNRKYDKKAIKPFAMKAVGTVVEKYKSNNSATKAHQVMENYDINEYQIDDYDWDQIEEFCKIISSNNDDDIFAFGDVCDEDSSSTVFDESDIYNMKIKFEDSIFDEDSNDDKDLPSHTQNDD